MSTGWESMWSANGGLQPGQAFDASCPAPILKQLCESGALMGGENTYALVPGCGRGYAVAQLATVFTSVVGLDIAPTAVDAAKDNLAQNYSEALRDKCSFSCADFFSYDPGHKFDCSYDYTFLCALDPSMRIDWAKTHARLLAPGGELLVMIFPICDKSGGPPYAIDRQLVQSLLEPVGLKEVSYQMLDSTQAHDGRDGTGMFSAKTALARYRFSTS